MTNGDVPNTLMHADLSGLYVDAREPARSVRDVTLTYIMFAVLVAAQPMYLLCLLLKLALLVAVITLLYTSQVRRHVRETLALTSCYPNDVMTSCARYDCDCSRCSKTSSGAGRCAGSSQPPTHRSTSGDFAGRSIAT